MLSCKVIAVLDRTPVSTTMWEVRGNLAQLSSDAILRSFQEAPPETAIYLARRDVDQLAGYIAKLPKDVQTSLIKRLHTQYSRIGLSEDAANQMKVRLDLAISSAAKFQTLGISIDNEFVILTKGGLAHAGVDVKNSSLKFIGTGENAVLRYPGEAILDVVNKVADYLGVKPSDLVLPVKGDINEFSRYKNAHGLPNVSLVVAQAADKDAISGEAQKVPLLSVNLTHGSIQDKNLAFADGSAESLGFALKLRGSIAAAPENAVAHMPENRLKSDAVAVPVPLAPSEKLGQLGVPMGKGFVILTKDKLDKAGIDTATFTFDNGYLKSGDELVLKHLLAGIADKLGIDRSLIVFPNKADVKIIAVDLKKTPVLAFPVVIKKSDAAGPSHIGVDVFLADKGQTYQLLTAKSSGDVLPGTQASITKGSLIIGLKTEP